jgi:rSAM-associated Gly-rich repeat protein
MKLLTQSRLFGVLLIAASLPFDTGLALALRAATQTSPTQQSAEAVAEAASSGAMEERLQRIAAAARERAQQTSHSGVIGPDAISYVVIGPGGLGWANGGWGNGGFYNGGWGNGGFGNGGFYNGFRNGGFGNGGWRGGRGWPNGW